MTLYSHAKAFNYIIDILKSKTIINENVILDIHKKLLSGIDDYNAGLYRNCPVLPYFTGISVSHGYRSNCYPSTFFTTQEHGYPSHIIYELIF